MMTTSKLQRFLVLLSVSSGWLAIAPVDLFLLHISSALMLLPQRCCQANHITPSF
ncbi:MAG: hypothetical protein WA919_23160 [Coleofasciculaceae cyanobacterium]